VTGALALARLLAAERALASLPRPFDAGEGLVELSPAGVRRLYLPRVSTFTVEDLVAACDAQAEYHAAREALAAALRAEGREIEDGPWLHKIDRLGRLLIVRLDPDTARPAIPARPK
jgi:hypothetical protein